MNPVAVLELVLVALVVLVGVTQVIIPLWRGTPLFPLFRGERRLEAELEEAQEEVVEADLRSRIEETRKKAVNVRKQGHE